MRDVVIEGEGEDWRKVVGVEGWEIGLVGSL